MLSDLPAELRQKSANLHEKVECTVRNDREHVKVPDLSISFRSLDLEPLKSEILFGFGTPQARAWLEEVTREI